MNVTFTMLFMLYTYGYGRCDHKVNYLCHHMKYEDTVRYVSFIFIDFGALIYIYIFDTSKYKDIINIE